jgi:class 3 adenylate cyclase
MDVSSARTHTPSVRVQRILLGALVAFALALEIALVVNLFLWRSAPDRGWFPMDTLGLNVVGQTRPSGEEAGLRNGDRILALNGEAFASTVEFRALFDRRLGNSNVYTIERDGQTLSIPVVNRPLGFERVLKQSGVFFALGLLLQVLGVLVFLMKPWHGPSWAFLLLSTFLSLSFMYGAMSAPPTPGFLDAMPILTLPFLGASLLHLTILFPQRRDYFADRPVWIALPYVVAAVLAAVARGFTPFATDLPTWVWQGVHLFGLACLVTFLGSILWSYLRTRSIAVRLQSLVIFTGTLIGFLIPMTEMLSNLFLGVSIFPNIIVFYFLCFIFFPLSIGYAIVRHDLFEIDVIVRRTYGYLLSTGAVLGVYGIVASTLNATVGPAARESGIFQVGFVLAVVLFFEPVHRRSQGFVDRIFYRAQYDYRSTITRASEAMMTILDPELVQQTLLGSVVGEMFLENGLLLLRESEGTQFEAKLVEGAGWGPRRLDLAPPLVDALLEARVAIFRHEVDLAPFYEAQRETLQACFDELDAEVMLPMIHQQELRGVLSLGRKKSGKMFTREDLDLLRTMTNQTVVALENARLFDEVAAGFKQIQLLESMKTNLAKFVPQTVQALIEESPDAAGLFEKREKDLSVMFADMTGFTRLSSQLPLDQVNAIVERYFGAFFDEILKQGGDVNETAGDGIMVLFQDGDSTEHARAAVRAALGIQRLADEINAERLAEDPGCIPIGMHIGVNSGIANVGATKIQGDAGARWTYTASGPTTNVAARVEALGEKIAVTEQTRRRLGEDFAVEELGPQTLKNVEHPVMVYRVLGARADAELPIPAARDAEPDAAPESQEAPERAGRFRIVGQLRERESGRALPNLVVRAFDKDMIFDDYLGDARSDTSGRFEIRFTDEFFRGLWDSHPDIYLRVFDASGSRELESTRGSVRWNAGAVESFEVEIPASKID